MPDNFVEAALNAERARVVGPVRAVDAVAAVAGSATSVNLADRARVTGTGRAEDAVAAVAREVGSVACLAVSVASVTDVSSDTFRRLSTDGTPIILIRFALRLCMARPVPERPLLPGLALPPELEILNGPLLRPGDAKLRFATTAAVMSSMEVPPLAL